MAHDPEAFEPLPLNYDQVRTPPRALTQIADRLQLPRPTTRREREELVRALWERHVLADMEVRSLPPKPDRRRGVSTILPSKPVATILPPKPSTPRRAARLESRVTRVPARPAPTASANFVLLPLPPDVSAHALRMYLDTRVGRVVHCRLSDGVACVTLAAPRAPEACRILNELAVDGVRLSAFPVHAVKFNKPPEARR
ncbi:hypothetical protein Q8F55_007564 [Vanrija albida]|uniref:Uncharacterized protein n=1 Tax=Vanrija albida TaxID=181172 RepID=A0ABR3PTV8_9TREE